MEKGKNSKTPVIFYFLSCVVAHGWFTLFSKIELVCTLFFFVGYFEIKTLNLKYLKTLGQGFESNRENE